MLELTKELKLIIFGALKMVVFISGKIIIFSVLKKTNLFPVVQVAKESHFLSMLKWI